jgi:hypothetical protein
MQTPNNLQARRVGIIENLHDILGFKDGAALECTTERYSGAVGGNTGNLAFVLGANVSIANHKNRIFWGTTPQRARELADHIVICCANQIGKHADLSVWAEKLLAFDMPVTLLGLGAQTTNYEDKVEVPDGTKRFLEAVTKLNSNKNGSNIGVRGEFTKNVLQDLGFDSQVTGCPSLFISSDASLGQTIASAEIAGTESKIAVAAGNPYHQETRKLEQNLVDLVEKTHGAYIVQHPDIMISLATGRLSETDIQKIPAILDAYGNKFSVDGLLKWFRRHGFAFYDAVAWIDFLRHYDFVIGPRYHGVALGVQAGRPSVVVHMDNRTRELATTTGIKSISAEDFKNYSLEDVLQVVKWSKEEGEAFDANRKMRAKILVEFLSGNMLEPSQRLLGIAN